MTILVGKKAPSFCTQAVLPDGDIVDAFDFGKAIEGKYGVLFFYPMDFTFVCPSEILAMANRTDALKALGCEVVGVSIDSHWTHNAWRNTAVSDGGIGKVPFTLAADMTREISVDYGILAEASESYYPPGVSMRATFITDKNGIIRHQVVNDEPIGRNMDEVVRIVEALKLRRKWPSLPSRMEQGNGRYDQHPRGCGILPRGARREALSRFTRNRKDRRVHKVHAGLFIWRGDSV